MAARKKPIAVGSRKGQDVRPKNTAIDPYEIWLKAGNVGTYDDFIDAIKGVKPSRMVPYAPWDPITDKAMLKRLGKSGEEAAELAKAYCRTIIQGLDEKDPKTGQTNREAIQDEIADGYAQSRCTIKKLGLDEVYIEKRASRKAKSMQTWEAKL